MCGCVNIRVRAVDVCLGHGSSLFGMSLLLVPFLELLPDKSTPTLSLQLPMCVGVGSITVTVSQALTALTGADITSAVTGMLINKSGNFA